MSLRDRKMKKQVVVISKTCRDAHWASVLFERLKFFKILENAIPEIKLTK